MAVSLAEATVRSGARVDGFFYFSFIFCHVGERHERVGPTPSPNLYRIVIRVKCMVSPRTCKSVSHGPRT
jgi:hypothetical protein